MWVLIGLDDKRIRNRCRNGHQNRRGGLDVVVMDVSRIDMAVMGSNSVDCSCVGDLGVRIAVNDSEGGGDGPRIDEFAATTGGGVGEDTICATSDPFFDVVSHFMPIEAEADTVECFEGHKMTTSGAGMKRFEDAASKGSGGNDQ